LYLRYAVLYYVIIVSSIAIFCFAVAARFGDCQNPASPQPKGIWAIIYPFSFPILSGIVGGVSLLFSKAAVQLLETTISGENQYIYPEPYICTFGLGLFLFLQMRWLNSALERFDALFVIPVYQVVWMISGTVGGGVVFDEFGVFDGLQWGMLPLGACINFFGIWLLTQRPAEPETDSRGHITKEPDGLSADGTKNVLAMAVQRTSVFFWSA